MALAAPLLTIHLAIAAGAAAPAAVVDGAIAEADAIWSPNGIAVVRGDDGRPGPTLTVVVTDAPIKPSAGQRAAGWSRPLGVIGFAPSGEASHRIEISMEAVRWLVQPNDPSAASRPLERELTLLARVAGRTLAHEIGHFLLQFPAHARDGLMASQHSALAFTTPDRVDFQLTPLFVHRLRAGIALLSAESAPRP